VAEAGLRTERGGCHRVPSLRPIRDLAEGTKRVTAGDYGQRLPVVQANTATATTGDRGRLHVVTRLLERDKRQTIKLRRSTVSRRRILHTPPTSTSRRTDPTATGRCDPYRDSHRSIAVITVLVIGSAIDEDTPLGPHGEVPPLGG
jgi:hypothetical protein